MLAGAVAAAGGGFTLHSDRGWHYRTPDWARACGEAGVERSMSRKGHSLLALPQNQPNAPLYPAGGAPGSRPGALPHFGRPRYLGPPPRARSTAG